MADKHPSKRPEYRAIKATLTKGTFSETALQKALDVYTAKYGEGPTSLLQEQIDNRRELHVMAQELAAKKKAESGEAEKDKELAAKKKAGNGEAEKNRSSKQEAEKGDNKAKKRTSGQSTGAPPAKRQDTTTDPGNKTSSSWAPKFNSISGLNDEEKVERAAPTPEKKLSTEREKLIALEKKVTILTRQRDFSIHQVGQISQAYDDFTTLALKGADRESLKQLRKLDVAIIKNLHKTIPNFTGTMYSRIMPENGQFIMVHKPDIKYVRDLEQKELITYKHDPSFTWVRTGNPPALSVNFNKFLEGATYDRFLGDAKVRSLAKISSAQQKELAQLTFEQTQSDGAVIEGVRKRHSGKPSEYNFSITDSLKEEQASNVPSTLSVHEKDGKEKNAQPDGKKVKPKEFKLKVHPIAFADSIFPQPGAEKNPKPDKERDADEESDDFFHPCDENKGEDPFNTGNH